MRLTIRVLGAEVFHVSTDVEPDEDAARALSGGTLGSDRIEAGPTDRYMGFTNGREVDDDLAAHHRRHHAG